MISIDRRAFLKAATIGAAAVSGPRSSDAAQNPAGATVTSPSRGLPDVAVVGAGAFGGWTAWYLREIGANVTLIDQYGPGNARSSSGGETRQLRANYGDQEIYTRWALEAMDRWRSREAEWGQTFFLQTGQVQLATEWTRALTETRKTFDRLKIAYEILSHDDVVRRYPQFDATGVEFAVFTPSTGVLRARESCHAVARSFEKKGGRILDARVEPGRRADHRLLDLQLSTGDRIEADTFVFACGPWLGKVFPDVLGQRFRTPRRVVFYYGTPPGDSRFSYPNFPTWSMPSGYGFPSVDGKGFKTAPAIDNVIVDPDLQERVPTAEEVARARAFLTRWFPTLKDQPLVEARVCQYEMSVDSEFFVSRHPALENVWLVGGGSGHGFKFGIMLGEYVARRVVGGRTNPEWDAFFALKEKTF
jgi:glycine/D-amino acid oxidase-like deaminating enzyme